MIEESEYIEVNANIPYFAFSGCNAVFTAVLTSPAPSLLSASSVIAKRGLKPFSAETYLNLPASPERIYPLKSAIAPRFLSYAPYFLPVLAHFLTRITQFSLSEYASRAFMTALSAGSVSLSLSGRSHSK